MKKTRSKKSRDTVPLSMVLQKGSLNCERYRTVKTDSKTTGVPIKLQYYIL
jgi:hypothetical protein